MCREKPVLYYKVSDLCKAEMLIVTFYKCTVFCNVLHLNRTFL